MNPLLEANALEVRFGDLFSVGPVSFSMGPGLLYVTGPNGGGENNASACVGRRTAPFPRGSASQRDYCAPVGNREASDRACPVDPGTARISYGLGSLSIHCFTAASARLGRFTILRTAQSRSKFAAGERKCRPTAKSGTRLWPGGRPPSLVTRRNIRAPGPSGLRAPSRLVGGVVEIATDRIDPSRRSACVGQCHISS